MHNDYDTRPEMIDVPSPGPGPAMLAMAGIGLTINVQLTDEDGTVLWDASSSVGRSRMVATPPISIMGGRATTIQIHLSQGPQGDPADIYTAQLACGCEIRCDFRPGTVLPCPEHRQQLVASVTYPYVPDADPTHKP